MWDSILEICLSPRTLLKIESKIILYTRERYTFKSIYAQESSLYASFQSVISCLCIYDEMHIFNCFMFVKLFFLK